MERAKIIKLIALALLIIVMGAVSFLIGDKHAVETMTIKRVTPGQIAKAMEGDYFYTDYRESTLLVKGVVSSTVKSSHDLTVEFRAGSSFKARCDFGNSTAIIRPGDTITAISEGASAERQPSAVMLKNCIIP